MRNYQGNDIKTCYSEKLAKITMKEFESFFKTVEGSEGMKCNYPTRLDTYGKGCQHDCKYCYAKSLLNFRGLWDAKEPAVANIEKIKHMINKNLKAGDIVRLGGMTDCFQPLERKYKVSYQTIEELNKKGIGYLIVTKSDIVADDEYIKLMDKKLAHIQITITCTSDEFCAKYEKATPPSKRIAAVEKLQEAGFDVQVRLSPFIPQFVSMGVLDMDIINNIKCDKILVEFLRVNAWIKKWFKIIYTDYSFNQSGYQHIPLKWKRYYLKLINGFKEVSVCEDVLQHYKYWRDNVNHNPNDCCNLRK